MNVADYEVIVVGAGPAGAMMTKLLAEHKVSVLCIEKEIEVGYPNKSTAGTPIDTFEIFNIPKSLAYEGIGGLRIFGPTESYVAEFKQVFGHLLMFREVKQYLIKQAIQNGATLMLGTEVVDFIREDGVICGITYKGFEGEGSVRANIIVDATGPEALLAAKLGMYPDSKPEVTKTLEYFSKPSVGGAFEYFLENAKPDKAESGFYLDIFVGNEWAPGGYSWIFPTTSSSVKAGICKMSPDYSVPNEKSQREYFQKLKDSNVQIKDAQPFEVHLCPYRHWVVGGLKSSTLDNFMAIGDAATKFQPVFGEGVRASFYSAQFATEAILEARKKNDYSKKTLAKYDELWNKKWGRNWEISTMVYRLLYQNTDEQLDKFVKIMQKFDPNILFRMYMGRASFTDYLAVINIGKGLLNRKSLDMLLKVLKP